MGIFDFFRKPRTWNWHYDRGMACGSGGKFDAALEHFKKAAEMAPGEPGPPYQLGYTYFLLKDFAKALPEFEKTQALTPGYFTVETDIDLCRRMLDGRLSLPALSILHQLLVASDSNQLGSPKSLTLAKQAVELAPDCPLAHFLFAKAVFATDPAESINAMQRCLEFGPDNTTAIQARLMIGTHLYSAGHPDQAFEMWRSILRDYSYHPLMALVNFHLNQYGKATPGQAGPS
ncbi:MAG: tetratricopeptide repeat protein [Candidatus Sumerlaeia bacterium]